MTVQGYTEISGVAAARLAEVRRNPPPLRFGEDGERIRGSWLVIGGWWSAVGRGRCPNRAAGVARSANVTCVAMSFTGHPATTFPAWFV